MSLLHTLSFILAGVLIAIGSAGLLQTASLEEMRALAMPGIFFGGSILIASLYGFKEPRHGLAAVSFVSFLAFLTSSAAVLQPLLERSYTWQDPADRSTGMVLLATSAYLSVALRIWRSNRRQSPTGE